MLLVLPESLMPITWDKKSMLMRIRDVVPHNVKVDACVQIGPGICGIIKPFGIDLADYASADNRLQVWIAIHSGGAYPNNIWPVGSEATASDIFVSQKNHRCSQEIIQTAWMPIFVAMLYHFI